MAEVKRTKIKVKKDSTIFSDGEWISNGFWLARRELVLVSDKHVQQLSKAGTVFSRRGGSLMVGKDAVVPKFAKVIPEITIPHNEGIAPTMFLFKFEEHIRSLFKRHDGELVAFASECAELLTANSNALLYQEKPLHAAVAYLVRDGEIVVQCVVMPIMFDQVSIAKEIERLIR